MKKTNILRMIIAAALLLSLVFSFAACGQPVSQTSSEPTAAASTEPTEAASPAASEQPADKPVLIMATNAQFPPYEYIESGKIVGIDAEIAGAIADKLGMTLEISDMEFDSIFAAVASGKADMGIAAMTIKPDRLENFDFSDIYATGKQVIIVKNDSPIAAPADLSGKKIGVQLGTTGDSYCSDEFGDEAMQRFSSGTEAVLALQQDKVDAVVIDNEPAKVYVSKNEGLKILPTDYALEDYAIMVAKGNTELLTKINAALAELKESGQLQAILDKYIKA